MRVIRTEMYFSEEDIFGLNRRRTSHARNPGLGFAWLRTDRPARGIDEQLLEDRHFDRQEGAATAFLDLAIRGYERSETISQPNAYFGATYNQSIVQSVMNGNIVIENSPPDAVTFRSLLAKAPGVAIGTMVGMKAAGDTSLLMLLTVPTGIVVCSSAIGVSKALEKGLNKVVEKVIKGTLL
jgi:hypothetical protein